MQPTARCPPTSQPSLIISQSTWLHSALTGSRGTLLMAFWPLSDSVKNISPINPNCSPYYMTTTPASTHFPYHWCSSHKSEVFIRPPIQQPPSPPFQYGAINYAASHTIPLGDKTHNRWPNTQHISGNITFIWIHRWRSVYFTVGKLWSSVGKLCCSDYHWTLEPYTHLRHQGKHRTTKCQGPCYWEFNSWPAASVDL